MYINAMGYYVPERRINNEYFKDINGLTADWIVQRTGIETRSRVSENENVNTMAFAAIDNALPELPYDIKSVDLIVAASYCAYDTVATPAHEAQRKYNINGAKAVYASAACSSFINGLEIIEGYFAMNKATKALLICSEQNSYFANEKDPKSGHLWGDAAVAYFVSKEKQSSADWEIIDIFTEGLGDIGKGPEGVKLRTREEGITMPDGRDVFIHACRYMIYAMKKSLGNSGLKHEDIAHFITHQANKRIVSQVAHQLDMPLTAFYNNIEELGNTGSASAALVLAQKQNEVKPGEYVDLMVFGGGYSCGNFIVRKPNNN